ncbi:hypothetical protein B0H67DRAFT_582066 [Lasiosphaeris hirsuta]|uniref:Ketoreductase (KR) domain-containing protein n=1 Tax=Lasiosphaeris hirsuta TaxID=260670 RepID=A0AA40AHL2_9PEZI|nr:hypothetical protein B0H67DRAFT_582066 [Lasiosphaeris hirsuta]
MVTLEQIRSSNARIATELPPDLVSVFLGGTGAVGETTMKQLAKLAAKPRIYIQGRSKETGDRLVAELKELNPDGEYFFIAADIASLYNVDDFCREIKSKESHINLLFMATGTLASGKDTLEGLPYHTSVIYYARIRVISNLLPLLQRASSLRRVVSVFAGTKEGVIDAADFEGRHLALTATRPHMAGMMTLALESLALEAPDVSFVHSFPGSVKTNLGKDVRTAPIMMYRAVWKVIGPLVNIPFAEAGERQLFLATSARFPARPVGGEVDVAATAGVRVGEEVRVAPGSNGEVGGGVYSVNFDGEGAPVKVRDALQKLRDNDIVRKLWLHTEDVFTRVTGAAFV